jgi:SPP1 gp7 family putative phage head morphogenesis protein
MLHTHQHTTDRTSKESPRERRLFNTARKAELNYARQLRGIARHVGDLVRRDYDANEPDRSLSRIREALNGYARLIRPWAVATAGRMLADVSRRDEAVWAKLSVEMGRALREEIRSAPTGEFLRDKLAENVELITSLPLEAAERVHKLTMRALEGGERAAGVAKEIMRSGHITQSRANLIARTEVARTASGLVEARAKHVGSEGYIWRTAGDADVRALHKKLNGKFFNWDDPPISGEAGERSHAGQIYNCRCYCEPVVPDEPDE